MTAFRFWPLGFLCFIIALPLFSEDLRRSQQLDFWGVPFGSSYEDSLSTWAAQGKIPDLQVDGPVYKRDAQESFLFFRAQHFGRFLAKDIQVVFSKGLLGKVRMVFSRGQNPPSYFEDFYKELKRSFDTDYFPSNKSLGFVKTGAGWVFPTGESIYMGFLIPSDLVLIIEGPTSPPAPGKNPVSATDQGSLFPRVE